MITYCRVYPTDAVAEHPAAATALARRSPAPDVVYLWADLSLTATPFPDEEVLLSADEPRWSEFCSDRLGFTVPDDLAGCQ